MIHETIQWALNHSFVLWSTLLCKIRTLKKNRSKMKLSGCGGISGEFAVSHQAHANRRVLLPRQNPLKVFALITVEVFFLGRWGGAASGVKWHLRGVIKIPSNPIAYSAKQALPMLGFLSRPNNERQNGRNTVLYLFNLWDCFFSHLSEMHSHVTHVRSLLQYKWKSHKIPFVMCFLILLRSKTG